MNMKGGHRVLENLKGSKLDKDAQVQKYLKEFDKKIGLKYVKLVHLNDSMNELESNVDRHEELGNGYIGKEGLKYFILFCNKYKIPIILESHGNHKKEMKFINSTMFNNFLAIKILKSKEYICEK